MVVVAQVRPRLAVLAAQATAGSCGDAMTKYARNVDGRWIDVWSVPENFPDYATLVKCLPGAPFVEVDGATENGDGVGPNNTTIPQEKPQAPTAQPNTPNNPYFGKQRLTGAQFVGLCIGALGVIAANRVSADPAFASIRLWVSTADVVIDPDDKEGQFLRLAGLPGADGYLTTALAADGQPLMTRTQRDAIMKAWK